MTAKQVLAFFFSLGKTRTILAKKEEKKAIWSTGNSKNEQFLMEPPIQNLHW
jgi:hypothetical protein